MMKSFLVFIFVFSFLAVVRPVLAEDTGITGFTTIIPGSNEDSSTSLGAKYATGDYTICDFFRMLANVVQVLFEMAAGAALCLFFWIAFGVISSWGDAEKSQGAFKGLKNIFYGLAIMLGAWFVVNALIVTLTAKVVPIGTGSTGKAAAIFNKPWSNLDDICKGL